MQTQITTAHYLIALALFSVAGCNQRSTNPQSTEPHVIAEGIIFSLEYELGDGRTGGFTRTNIAEAVPGGNGSWNVDANGRLTQHYLVITYPQKKSLGSRVIPAHRLVDIQFGDGGIKNVNENKPEPAGQH